MDSPLDNRLGPRLRDLPRAEVRGTVFPVARGLRSRLLGLALLDARDAVPGLLIPRCSRVHTFGMRFPLDVYFLDRRHEILGVKLAVPPRRFVGQRGSDSVLELPLGCGVEVRLRG